MNKNKVSPQGYMLYDSIYIMLSNDKVIDVENGPRIDGLGKEGCGCNGVAGESSW